MSPSIENPQVKIGTAEGKDAFEIFVDDSGSAAGFTQFVEYEQDGVKQRIFPHTFVKDEFEGQGLASKLVKEALDQSIEQGFRIVAVCPYIKNWIAKHSEYAQHSDAATAAHLEALR